MRYEPPTIEQREPIEALLVDNAKSDVDTTAN
jgi:hypothetical protein